MYMYVFGIGELTNNRNRVYLPVCLRIELCLLADEG